jgi:hypothetical protein
MSLRNFHVDSNVTDFDLLKRSGGLLKNFVASFRQAAANGHFSFGGITLQDHDLNRVHGIVTSSLATTSTWWLPIIKPYTGWKVRAFIPCAVDQHSIRVRKSVRRTQGAHCSRS